MSLPLASAVRRRPAQRQVAFQGDLPSGDARTMETPSTIIRCSDLKPGQTLSGHVVDLVTGERRAPSANEKRMYLMPWGEAIIGVDPKTRKKLDRSVALAWEYDHWFMRCMRTSIDAEGLIGSIGRHPLHPPIDHDRLDGFQVQLGTQIMFSPLKHFDFNSICALDMCSRAHYVRIKFDTGNVMGHAQQLHCTICGYIILKDAMQCCEQCKIHMPACSSTCFNEFWKRTHKAVCKRHKLVKSYAKSRDD